MFSCLAACGLTDGRRAPRLQSGARRAVHGWHRAALASRYPPGTGRLAAVCRGGLSGERSLCLYTSLRLYTSICLYTSIAGRLQARDVWAAWAAHTRRKESWANASSGRAPARSVARRGPSAAWWIGCSVRGPAVQRWFALAGRGHHGQPSRHRGSVSSTWSGIPTAACPPLQRRHTPDRMFHGGAQAPIGNRTKPPDRTGVACSWRMGGRRFRPGRRRCKNGWTIRIPSYPRPGPGRLWHRRLVLIPRESPRVRARPAMSVQSHHHGPRRPAVLLRPHGATFRIRRRSRCLPCRCASRNPAFPTR